MSRTMLDVVEEEVNRLLDDLRSNGGSDDLLEVIIPLVVGPRRNVAIIDIETTGLHPPSSKIVTLGIIHVSTLHIIQCMNMDIDEFQKVIEEFMKNVARDNDFFAYNKSFEIRFLGYPTQFSEIWPYRMKKDDCVNFAHFHFGVGKDVTKWWKKWTKEKDEQALVDIVKHNSNCLLKEMAIFSVNADNAED